MSFAKWWKLAQRNYDTKATPADVAGALIEDWGQDAGAMWVALLDDTRPRLAALMHALQVSIQEASGTKKADVRFLGGLAGAILGVGGPFHKDEGTPNEAMIGGFLALAMPIPDFAPDTETLIAGFNAVQTLWESVAPADLADLKHPLTALIEGWLNRPELLQPDVDKHGRPRTKGIIPSGLFPGTPATITAQLRSDNGADLLPALGPVDNPGEKLPLYADWLAENDLPVAPLILADAAGFRGLQPGRGARYDKRFLIFCLLEMPLNQRRPGGQYELRKPLRFWRDLLLPTRPRLINGRRREVSSYRPSVHALPLHSAMQAINLAEIEMPDGYRWRPVIVRGYPAFDDLDSEVIIQIELPDGSDRGPQIDKPALVAAGTISDPAFDLQLGLAYLWDEAKRRNASFRVYATRPEVLRDAQGYITDADDQVIIERGRPVTRWNHPRSVRTGRTERNSAADRVRVLDRERRRRLAYGRAEGKTKQHLRNERAATERLLAGLESEGRIVIERDAVDARTGKQGWLILEAWLGGD